MPPRRRYFRRSKRLYFRVRDLDGAKLSADLRSANVRSCNGRSPSQELRGALRNGDDERDGQRATAKTDRQAVLVGTDLALPAALQGDGRVSKLGSPCGQSGSRKARKTLQGGGERK